LLIHVLRACGDDLTRANVLKQATSLKNVPLDLLLPGIVVTPRFAIRPLPASGAR
jgi:branched-chain amino acid transport system substrate-binding protein